MTDRPLEINEMAVRRMVQMVWFGCLTALIVWFIWPSIMWGLDGFTEHKMPDGYTVLLHGFLAILDLRWGLRAGGTFRFELVPFAIARLIRPKGHKISRLK
ncbi:MAG: hypothetical protein ACFBZ9_10925 [Sphingomonadales bacterium]